jgi:hypothetical protein
MLGCGPAGAGEVPRVLEPALERAVGGAGGVATGMLRGAEAESEDAENDDEENDEEGVEAVVDERNPIPLAMIGVAPEEKPK